LRVIAEHRAYEILADDAVASISELRDTAAQARDGAVDPEAIWNLAEELSYDATIGWCGAAACDSFDVVLSRRAAGTRHKALLPLTAKSNLTVDSERYTNDPLTSIFSHRLIPGLRSHLRDRLPEYMVPAAFVVLNRMPQTPSGKIDRRALPAPESIREISARVYVAPRNTVEQTLADIWAEILNLDQIGVNENFFDLGGHSLLATQLVSRVRAAFDNEIPVRAVFENPTIAALASNTGLSRPESRPASLKISRATMRQAGGPAAETTFPSGN